MNLNELTINQARQGLKTKKFSSVELTKACLKQIKKIDKKIRAFITVCEKEALQQATKIDQKNQKSSTNTNLLAGIPLALKDNFCTKNIKTTAASKVLANYIPVNDATVVQRLKKAGAIILGKTNLDAWAHGSSGENSDFQVTRNPWNLKFVPGGSSSGSAASVAARMSLAATGTDTAGSIRLPASFCHLVGLKPTYGRVSRSGIIAMGSSLDSIGHLTRTVEDSALLLKVTAGQDVFDATTPAVPVPDYLTSLKKIPRNLKIGLPREYFQKGIDSQVKKLVEQAAEEFSRLGIKLISVSLPHTQYALATYYLIQPSEVSSNLGRYDGLRFGFNRENFGDEAKRRIILGTFCLSAGYYEAYYLKAMQVRTLIKKDFEKAFQKVDLLLTPVSPTLPFKIGEKVTNPLTMYLSDVYTATANLAGLPALALPAGLVQGLPVGFQLLGPQFSESLLFQAGFAYQQKANWLEEKPNL